MHDLLSYFIAFSLTFLFIYLFRSLAIRLHLVDSPDSRKQHEGDIPLIGGLAILIGFLFSLLVLPVSLMDYRSFIAGCVLLVIVGVLDDFHELSTRSRLVAQIIAALLMTAWGGIILTSLGKLFFTDNVILNNWALPTTVIAVVGIINAVNMTDGVDGLAGTLAWIEIFFLAMLARKAQQMIAFHILVLMMSSILGFLFFNFPLLSKRKTTLVFMGDAGSMLLGFFLVWFLVQLSQARHFSATPVSMLWIMALPLFDIGNVMLYRLQNRKSIFSPDRQHLHHVLEKLNFSSLVIVTIMGCIAFAFGLVGLWGNYAGIREGYLFIGFIFLFIIYHVSVTFLRRHLRACDQLN